VKPHGVGMQTIARTGLDKGGWKTFAEIAEQRRNVRVSQIMALDVKVGPTSSEIGRE
jgi:hypothetical protein